MRTASHIAAICGPLWSIMASTAGANQSTSTNQAARVADSIVAAEGLTRGVPGVALTIVSRGRVVLARGYGLADRAAAVAVTDSTPFNIASVTKPFTAIAAVRLARKGVVDLDEPLGRWLPWLPAGYRSRPLRLLLTHTSGVVRDVRDSNDDDPDAAEYRARVERSAASFEPGERFEYSNAGYTLLGWALEAAARQDLGAVLRQEIFAPAMMTTAAYRTAPVRPRAKPYAVGRDRSVRDTTWLSGGHGSGGIVLSARDAARFAVALQEGRLIDSADQASAWTTATLGGGSPIRTRAITNTDGYGFGWWVSDYRGRRLVSHGGGITGFSAFLWHFPDQALTIFAVANAKARDDGRAPVDPIVRALADFCLAKNPC